jgi:uncharacterized protein YbbC (DUF1343 family)
MLRLLTLALLLLAACASPDQLADADCADSTVALADLPAGDCGGEMMDLGAFVQTGADVLAARGFSDLDGMRVGLVVNHTAQVGGQHLIDAVSQAEGVSLGALFGPEHGLRGTADAGEKVDDGVDDATGTPIFSLYGANRKPSQASLEGLDALVFDIQDVGARFYTYISTMGLAMQAAAEAGIPFYVLDRPNPVGGDYVAGWTMQPEYESFVGQYPIPLAHGMTVGELALMIKGEAMMDGLEDLDLRIVEMDGWNRAQRWNATGLTWDPPSPNLPTFETAALYPGTGFFEAFGGSEGRGTDAPFATVGATWTDADALAADLNARDLPGVRAEPLVFTPAPNAGAASPRFEGETVEGVRLFVTDHQALRPVELGVHLATALRAQGTADQVIERPDWLGKLAGSAAFEQMIRSGADAETIIASWQDDVEAFEAARRPYLLYD